MSKIPDEVLAANTKYAENFGDKGNLPLPPSRHFAILTCMDARLDPAKYAGLAEGDAHVIRNAGGRASDDAIRSLVISYKLRRQVRRISRKRYWSRPGSRTVSTGSFGSRMRDRRICLAPRRSGADHQHYDANDRQAAASRPVSGQGRTEERDWWRSAQQYPTRWPDIHLGLRQPFSPPPSTQIGCIDPGGASAGGRLDQAHLPNFVDLLRDIAIL